MQRKASVVESHSSNDRRQSGPYKSNGPRKSIYPGRRQSISMTSRKSSQDGGYPRIKLQNTYRMAPEENEKFKAYKLEPKLYEILENSMKHLNYDPRDEIRTKDLTKEISQEILREARNIMMSISPRYKLMSYFVMGENKGQFNLFIFFILSFLFLLNNLTY